MVVDRVHRPLEDLPLRRRTSAGPRHRRAPVLATEPDAGHLRRLGPMGCGLGHRTMDLYVALVTRTETSTADSETQGTTLKARRCPDSRPCSPPAPSRPASSRPRPASPSSPARMRTQPTCGSTWRSSPAASSRTSSQSRPAGTTTSSSGSRRRSASRGSDGSRSRSRSWASTSSRSEPPAVSRHGSTVCHCAIP